MRSACSSVGTSVANARRLRSASAGMPLKRGASESTRFTFAHGPSILIASTDCRNASGRSPGSTSPRNVRFGIRVRNHDGRPELGAIFQRHAPGAAVLDEDARDRRLGSDLGAGLASRGRHRLRDRPHAADHVPVPALHVVVAAREEVEQQADRRARPVRRGVHPVHVVRQVHPFDRLGLEVPVEEVAERAGQELGEVRDLVAPDPLDPPVDAPALPDAIPPARVDVRRLLEEERLEVAGEPFQPACRCGRTSPRRAR